MGKLEIENSKSYTHEYFEKQLDALGLSVETIRSQDEKGLGNCLRVTDHAIQNHQSFGEVEIRVPSENGEIVGISYNQTLIKIGILPLLLESYKLILKRLEQYRDSDGINRIVNSDESNDASIKDELTKIAQGEVNRRLWVAIGVMIV